LLRLNASVFISSTHHTMYDDRKTAKEIDGKKYVGDSKTSNAVYPEYFYQTAAYRMMLEEMGEKDFSGSIIIRVGKDGSFDEAKDVIFSKDYEEQKDAT
jgi:hypothetical protein